MRDASPRRWVPIKVCVGALSLVVVSALSCGDPVGSPGSPLFQGGDPAEAESVAANPFGGCDMCHIDVADEVVGTRHQAKGVGCVKCHGRSLAHVRDENNEVKPDRVFPRNRIDAFCSTCHKCSRPAAAKPGRKVCTDCHGTHKIVRVAKR